MNYFKMDVYNIDKNKNPINLGYSINMPALDQEDRNKIVKWLTEQIPQNIPKKKSDCYFSGPLRQMNNKYSELYIPECYIGILNIYNMIDFDYSFGYISSYPNSSRPSISLSITPYNIDRCLTYMTIINIIDINYLNSKLCLTYPKVNSCLYNQFINDCMVYSIFSTNNKITSLRNIDNQYNFNNNLFFLSKDYIKQLAIEYKNESVLKDIYNHPNNPTLCNILYNKLKSKEQFSSISKDVLKKGMDLYKSSFKYRDYYNNIHPEHQVNNWDCSFYQLKQLLKSIPQLKEEYREFKKLMSDFKQYLRVFDFGFLNYQF